RQDACEVEQTEDAAEDHLVAGECLAGVAGEGEVGPEGHRATPWSGLVGTAGQTVVTPRTHRGLSTSSIEIETLGMPTRFANRGKTTPTHVPRRGRAASTSNFAPTKTSSSLRSETLNARRRGAG